jgi:hypothetical protein
MILDIARSSLMAESVSGQFYPYQMPQEMPHHQNVGQILTQYEDASDIRQHIETGKISYYGESGSDAQMENTELAENVNISATAETEVSIDKRGVDGFREQLSEEITENLAEKPQHEPISEQVESSSLVSPVHEPTKLTIEQNSQELKYEPQQIISNESESDSKIVQRSVDSEMEEGSVKSGNDSDEAKEGTKPEKIEDELDYEDICQEVY